MMILLLKSTPEREINNNNAIIYLDSCRSNPVFFTKDDFRNMSCFIQNNKSELELLNFIKVS